MLDIQRQQAERKPSEWQGEVGHVIYRKLLVLRKNVRYVDAAAKDADIVGFVDDDGNEYVWFASRMVDEWSEGDELFIRASLKSGGSSVGWAVINCTSMSPRSLLQCVATAKIQGRGKISVAGAFVQQGKVHASLSITGGSGEFRNARGQLEVDDTGPNTASFAFHLLP